MGRRAILLRDKQSNEIGWLIQCPACARRHILDQRWTFSGTDERPSFHPSLMVRKDGEDGLSRCHSFIKDGKISYLIDSTHEYAGKTVDLEEF